MNDRMLKTELKELKMTKKEFMDIIEQDAKEYYKDAKDSIIRNKGMNNLKGDEIIDKNIVEATIVDFINFLGYKQGLDYGMYVKHLYED
jgi:hypothetical protein